MNGRREEVVGDDEQNPLEKEKNKNKEAENSHDVMETIKSSFKGKMKFGNLESNPV